MAEAIDKPAIYADIEALPPNVVGELLDDRLFQNPRPPPRHAFAAAASGGELVAPHQVGRGVPGVPDMAGRRVERIPNLPDTAYFETAPEWACEFLSPSTRRVEKGAKRVIDAEISAAHFWYIDQLTHTFLDDDDVAALPFDAVPFSLGALWPVAPKQPSIT